MSHAILGRKIEMTQVFTEDGTVVPVTVIEAGPCPVVQVKTIDRDGYGAYQIGFDRQRKNVRKPLKGHFRKHDIAAVRHLHEMPYDGDATFEPGNELRVDQFVAGDCVDVVGTSKGKGFAGTIKRHGFSRGPMTHGSMNRRRPGSIGQASTPSRVLKGVRMSGQMGNVNRTAKNLQVVRVDLEANLLFIKGSIPGANGGIVFIRDARTGATAEQRSRAYDPQPVSAD